MLLTLYVILELTFFLKALFANATSKLFFDHFFNITSEKRFFLFLSVELGQLLSVDSELFSFNFTLGSLLGFNLVSTFLSGLPIFLLEVIPTWILTSNVGHKLFNFVVKLVSFSVASTIVVIFDQSLDTPVWSVSWVIHVHKRELFDTDKGFPVFVEFVHLFLAGILIAKFLILIVLSAHFFLLLFFIIKLLKQLTKHAVKICTVLCLKETSKRIIIEEFVKLVFGNVTTVIFCSSLTNVFASQNLVSMSVIPSSFLIIRQTRVCCLNLLEFLCCVNISILIGMPLQRGLFVSLYT